MRNTNQRIELCGHRLRWSVRFERPRLFVVFGLPAWIFHNIKFVSADPRGCSGMEEDFCPQHGAALFLGENGPLSPNLRASRHTRL